MAAPTSMSPSGKEQTLRSLAQNVRFGSEADIRAFSPEGVEFHGNSVPLAPFPYSGSMDSRSQTVLSSSSKCHPREAG